MQNSLSWSTSVSRMSHSTRLLLWDIPSSRTLPPSCKKIERTSHRRSTSGWLRSGSGRPRSCKVWTNTPEQANWGLVESTRRGVGFGLELNSIGPGLNSPGLYFVVLYFCIFSRPSGFSLQRSFFWILTFLNSSQSWALDCTPNTTIQHTYKHFNRSVIIYLNKKQDVQRSWTLLRSLLYCILIFYSKYPITDITVYSTSQYSVNVG